MTAAPRRTLLAGLFAAALAAAPSTAIADATSAVGCPDLAVSQPFERWGDTSEYFLAPDGGFEDAAEGWTLTGGAEVVMGGEPARVVARDDRHALRIPADASATTAPFCVGPEHRTMRFFARATGSSVMDVDVLYSEPGGDEQSARLGTLDANGWAPTDTLGMRVHEIAAERGESLSARLRFTPSGKGSWTIDDVLIDPYRGR